MIKWLRNTASLERIGYAFTDAVDGKPVYYYRDKDGVVWMKNSKWGLFSVRSSHGGEDSHKYVFGVNTNHQHGIQRKNL